MNYSPPIWHRADGSPVSCLEKIKVLNENIEELRQMAQDALEDAVLLECTETQIRQAFHDMVDSLKNPYPETR